MLSRSTHNQIASKINPERERRLLCMNDDDTDTNGIESLGNVEDGNEHTEDGAIAIDDMRSSVGSAINTGILTQENLESIIHNPSVLTIALEGGTLSDERRYELEQFLRDQSPETFSSIHPEAHIPARQIVEFLQQEENTETADRVRDAIAESLETPEALLGMTKQLDERLAQYELVQKVLYEYGGIGVGNLINIERIQHFFDEWNMRGLTGNEVDIADWLCDTYDIREPDAGKLTKIFNEIFRGDLEPELTRAFSVSADTATGEHAEVQKAQEAALAQLEKLAVETDEAKDIPRGLQSTYSGLKHRIRHATTSLTKFLRMQDNDREVTPSAETRTTSAQTVDSLRAEVDTLKQALDANLQQRASTLEANLNQRLRADGILNEDNTINTETVTDPHRIKDQFDISSQALLGQVLPRAYSDVQRIQRTIDPELPVSEQNIAPDIHSADYTIYAEQAIRELNELERREQNATRDGYTGFEQQYFDEARHEQHQSTEWAHRLVEEGTLQNLDPDNIAMVQDLLHAELQYQNEDEFSAVDIEELPQALEYLQGLAQRVAHPDATGEDFNELYFQLDSFGQDRIMRILGLINDPRSRNAIARGQQELAAASELQNTADVRERLDMQLDEAMAELLTHKHLQHTVCKTLQINDGLQKQAGETKAKIAYAKAYEGKPKALRAVREAKVRVDQLKQAAVFLNDLDNASEEYAGDSGKTTFGQITGDENACAFYNRDTGKIMLNRPAITDSGKSIEFFRNHELGHAVLHILTERSGILEGKLFQILNLIRQDIPQTETDFGGNRTFDALLQKQADKWGLASKRGILRYRAIQELGSPAGDEKAEEQFAEMLFDELIVKHSDWVAEGRLIDNTDPEQIALFKHIDANFGEEEEVPALDQVDFEQGKITEALGSFETGDDANNSQRDVTQTNDGSFDYTDDFNGGGNEGGGRGNGADDFGNLGGMDDDEGRGNEQTEVVDIDRDLRKQRADIEKIRVIYESYPEYKAQLQPYYNEFSDANNEIYNAYNTEQSPPDKVLEAIQYVNNSMKPLQDFIAEIKSDKLDVSSAKADGKQGWRRIWDHVEFMSVMDIVNLVKEGAEDIQRMWKRRGEAMRSRIGEGLTDWIPQKIPYAGRLQSEFHRRNKASEVEEVNQWKEALKDGDSYELQELLATARNPDLVRALLELLQERGRLDWNDEALWKTLNYLSNYNMPIVACRHDDVLRDRWLGKMLTDIFGDKDHYFNWRQGNDSAIESGKKKFTPTVDQFANVSGGMGAALKNQLELYVNAKSTGQSIPEEVNPHLYEEILHYAIRMGKMTMEGKFFYLIQGIRWGLLSIDRLRVMAGAGGEFLNIFPFIDYFYQKNNSLEEIKLLGERIEEKGDPYSPGFKTTMFVRMEIAREESVKQRLRKGITKKGEETDHDDIPYFLPELDYGTVDEWFANMSGGRQKLSKEALKNAYVGFSMKFKTFAALAEMDRNRSKRFTRSDLKDMASTIAAYIHGDNILTRNGYDDSKLTRPSLSRGEYGQVAVLANGKNKVSEYRDSLNTFSEDVIAQFITDADWTQINGHLGVNINDPAEVQRTKDEGLWVDASNYSGLDIETNYANKKLVRKISDSTGVFQEILEQKLLANEEQFKQILLKYSSGNDSGEQIMRPGMRQFFIEDGAVSGEFDNQKIVDLYK